MGWIKKLRKFPRTETEQEVTKQVWIRPECNPVLKNLKRASKVNVLVKTPLTDKSRTF